MAIQQEPNIFNEQLVGSGGPSGGQKQPVRLAHDYLMVQTDDGDWEPHLAQEAVSTENGTWRINTDGSMDTIWRIRPNVKWHDGVPFTSDDLLFSYTVYSDRDVPAAGGNSGAALRLMESVAAPDPFTFIIHWSSTFVDADRGIGLDPLARHLFEDIYRTDKANLDKNPRLREEFVGLGPYRLTRWEQGSLLELTRFDDYYRGRPPLDRVIVRILRDLNAVVANVLAGDVDVVPNFVLDPEAVVEMRRRWAGTTNQAMVTVDTTGFQILEVQHRPEYAQPAFGLATLEVRQALNGAIDRVTLADVMTGGLAPPADSWIAPTTHRRSQVESAIPQYPYDLTRSRQLLAAAGWRPGDGGTLAHERTGQPFTLQISARGDVSDERLGSIIADQWKALGVQATLQPIPPALASDRQVLSTHPGVLIASGNAEFLQTDRLHSKNVTAEANRWNGSNRGGYSNPRVDALYDRLAITIEPGARLELTRQLLSETMSDVALMPLYWSTKVWLAVADVRGIKDGGTWNAFEWDRG